MEYPYAVNKSDLQNAQTKFCPICNMLSAQPEIIEREIDGITVIILSCEEIRIRKIIKAAYNRNPLLRFYYENQEIDPVEWEN